MTGSFFFTQKVANVGFNPPQNSEPTMQKKIADEQKQETRFFNMVCDGNEFKRNDLKQERSGKNMSKKGPLESEDEKDTFWTICPYCYYMYEYEKKYEECCLLCQNCRKGFHGLAVAAPPDSLLVKGKEGEYYSGYGFFPLGCFGDSFLGDKKEVDGGDTGKKHDVVEISDDSYDEKKEINEKKEGRKVKVEVLNNGGGRGVMKRVKSVRRNTKKMMGRGIKGKKVEKMSVPVMNVKFGNGVADGGCGSGGGASVGSGCWDGCNKDELMSFSGMNVEFGNGVGNGGCGSGGGISVGSGCRDGCNEDELVFCEGDDDIYVGLKDVY